MYGLLTSGVAPEKQGAALEGIAPGQTAGVLVVEMVTVADPAQVTVWLPTFNFKLLTVSFPTVGYGPHVRLQVPALQEPVPIVPPLGTMVQLTLWKVGLVEKPLYVTRMGDTF